MFWITLCIVPILSVYESLHLHKKDSFLHPGSAKKGQPNKKIEHHGNYFTDLCDKHGKTSDDL